MLGEGVPEPHRKEGKNTLLYNYSEIRVESEVHKSFK